MSKTTNQVIHEWRGLCWHKIREARSDRQMSQGKICDVCGEGWLRYGPDARKAPKSGGPAYDTSPAACFELIEAVRAKGIYVATQAFPNATEPYMRYRVELNPENMYSNRQRELAQADTLPAALAQAVIALIQGESK